MARQKQNKRKTPKAETEAVAQTTGIESVQKVKKDKSKKKNKSEKQETPAEVTAPPATSEGAEQASADVESGEKKKKKKDKEKKRKREAEEAATNDTTTSEAGAEADTAEKKKKKKKKNKEGKKESTGDDETAAVAPEGQVRVSSDECYQQPAPSDSSFRKSFYSQHPAVSAMTDAALSEFHATHQITVTGARCGYKPVQAFEHTGFSKKVLSSCAGFEKPTPIQAQCWPILSSGRDIIGIAETGSGKTLAFTLPALVHILSQRPEGKAPGGGGRNSSSRGPVMLVVAPTRELAMQSAEVAEAAGKACGIGSVCVYGGVSKHEQRAAIRSGVGIVVATPGRLKDLSEDGSISLAGVTYLVLDEADRMLDLGFEKDVRAIIGATNPERQTAMFSATWPQSVQTLASEFLSDPVKVTIGSDDLCASGNVTQIVEVVEDRERDRLITNLLQKYHSNRRNRVLLFVLYKKEAARVERTLQHRGWNCVAIHGDKDQASRTRAVEQFKSGSVPLLIATDVAARGLDIPGVEYVLNYSFPLTIEDYVHRIGRTGRGGNKGISHTFFTAFDKPRAGELVNLLRESNQEIPDALTKFGTHVKKKEHKLYGAFGKDVDMTVKAKKITFEDSDDE